MRGLNWDNTPPKKTGYYIVETTTKMGNNNILLSLYNKDKKTWSFKNQDFNRYLPYKRTEYEKV